MTDPRDDLRRVRGQWLQLLERLRAIDARLAAAEADVSRRAHRTGDAELGRLATEVAAKRADLRRTIDALRRRIDGVQTACDTLSDAFVAALVRQARAAAPGSPVRRTGRVR